MASATATPSAAVSSLSAVLEGDYGRRVVAEFDRPFSRTVVKPSASDPQTSSVGPDERVLERDQ